MRAEAQSHIDQINAATALLRRFLDWDKAQRRLGELNEKVEDPALWNDPKAAQDVMRERFCDVVETATGRRVIGFMSGNQQDPDMICEVFVLEKNPLFEAD